MKLCDMQLIYSGKKDGVHRQGAGLMINKEAAKSCVGRECINNRTLVTHFITKKCRVEFYLQLQEQIDRVPGRNMVFPLGDFNAQFCRARDR